jgi:hypothetical protein
MRWLMSGRSIKLFLVDGSPTGLITAEIGQWTGKATVVTRQRLELLAARAEAHRPGIYVLSGPDPDQDDRDRVYIGEAEDVYSRLRQHLAGKDFWTRACLFTSSDEQLTKAHVKYLESRLVEVAYGAGRAAVDNGNTPPRPGLPEADVADMESYLEQARILLPVLGFMFAQPIASRRREPAEGPIFELSAVGAHAKAREDEDGFVVLRGSTARVQGVDSWTTGPATRDRLVSEGVLRLSSDPDYYEFVEDYGFSSPTLAGAIVLARNTNGRQSWKTPSGKSYAEWQEEKIRAAEATATRE